MIDIKVKKKDGSLEDFDRTKIKSSVTAAGLAEEQAEILAAETEIWVYENSGNEEISSSQIREKVIELLEEQDSTVAASYKTYEKK
ncbi:MAG: ATP cone domain-containing protein [Patescibacteria group bacterium]